MGPPGAAKAGSRPGSDLNLAYAHYFALTGIDQAAVVGYPTGYGDIEWYSIYDGWASWEATGSSYWVKPGQSLSGFRIRSHHGPGVDRAEWIAYADTVESGSTRLVAIEYEGGDIIAPMVPEPASMALTALTLGIIVGVLRRRCARSATWQQIPAGAENHVAEEA